MDTFHGDYRRSHGCAVITTLNEASSIGALVAGLHEHDLHVIVVDDASSDETAHAARLAGAAVYVNRERIGIGPSLMKGWRLALDMWADYVIQIDAGGSHLVSDVPAMRNALASADMVIGSRFLRDAKYVAGGNWRRPLLSRLAAFMCNRAQHGANHTDWTSGYRAFRASLLQMLLGYPYQAKMHGWQIEVLARANEVGAEITEVPITYIAGRSSFNRRVANEAIRSWLHVMNHVGPRPAYRSVPLW